MTDVERLIALGVPTQLAPELVRMMGGGFTAEQYEALRLRVEALELIVQDAIVTDEAP